MTVTSWARVKEIFECARALPAAEREAYVRETCNGSAELRQEIESLLGVYDRDQNFLEEPALAPESLVGQRAGNCELIRLVGHGGMSAVYEGIRGDGEFRQRVAVKVLKRGMDTDSLLQRFRTERQILAGFAHPNIARLIDGGALADGRPFLTMEFIDGIPLTQFCEEGQLSIGARLDLFLQVCSGVAAAHRSLIVHRDIKPANVLVTARGECKLLDFGIAKILEPEAFPRTLAATIAAERLLTPDYASPEQARGEPITTASDIYSLGVLLYEILTGRHPYQVETRHPDEIARLITQTEFPRPSAAVEQKSSRSLRGDLDNIVLKAMRKEPERRYHSVDEFAEDIRRHREGLPVKARKETPGYVAAKFIQRNKALSASLALLLVAVTAGMTAVVWQARRAERERARAEQRFQEIRRVAGSVIFEMHDAIARVSGATTARELVLRRATEMLDGLAKDAGNDAALDLELAAGYKRLAEVQGHPMGNNLGDTAAARASYNKAVRLGKAALAIEPNNRAAQLSLASSYQNLSSVLDLAEAEGAINEAIRLHEAVLRHVPDDHDARGSLGLDYQRRGSNRAERGDTAGALADAQQSVALLRELVESPGCTVGDETQLAFSHKHVGGLYIQQNRLDEALKEYLAALALEDHISTERPGDFNNEYNKTFAYDDIGFIYRKRKDFPKALQSYGKALAVREAQSLNDPKNVRVQQGRARTVNYLAGVRHDMGDRKGEMEVYRRDLAIAKKVAAMDPGNAALQKIVADAESKAQGK